jgi:hypothetical protein
MYFFYVIIYDIDEKQGKKGQKYVNTITYITNTMSIRLNMNNTLHKNDRNVENYLFI